MSLKKSLFMINLFFLSNCFAKDCVTFFGAVLSRNNDVIAYSNCNNNTETSLKNTINLANQNIETGIKWQCVEYARRWLIIKKGISFDSIDHAFQIWDLKNAYNVNTKINYPWRKFKNNKTSVAPQKGDLLIYDQSMGVHGHVALILDKDLNFIYIGEQNYHNQVWPKKTYARKVPFIKNKKGKYQIIDEGLIGWMRY